MRRFEFVDGTSAKFWMPSVEGSTFTVAYGRIGTAGQRKEKTFDDEAAARKEHDKKVAEKLREGYVEVIGDDGAAAPVAAPKAVAPKAAPAVVLLPLPVRITDAENVDAALVAAATKAVQALVRQTAGRSWRRRQAAKEAHRALARIAGVDVVAHPALGTALDAAADAVVSAPSLPLPVVLRALSSLPTAAIARAMTRWQAPSGAAASALTVLNGLSATFNDVELTFRLGRLLVDKDLADTAALRGIDALKPFVEARFAGGFKGFVDSLDSAGDVVVARRQQVLRA